MTDTKMMEQLYYVYALSTDKQDFIDKFNSAHPRYLKEALELFYDHAKYIEEKYNEIEFYEKGA